MKQYNIALLPGDGIGPEVVAETVKVLEAAAPGRLAFEELSVGAGQYLKSGNPLPPETFERIQTFDAILLGAMGLPDIRWPDGTEMAPQLDLREKLDLFAGPRPIKLYHSDLTPLKGKEAGAIDFVILRENTEGLFSSRKGAMSLGEDVRVDGLKITRRGAERLFHEAFRMAAKRRKKVTLVDKSNVLQSLAFFRGIFDEVAEQYPDIESERIYIDATALYLVRRPEDFDVMVTENMFGDILSDLAAGLIGGMGLAPSGDIGEKHAVFQPSHGSAPDIAGKGISNPLATILSAAMMLEWLRLEEESKRVHGAVEAVLGDSGNRTPDLGGKMRCEEMGAAVAGAL